MALGRIDLTGERLDFLLQSGYNVTVILASYLD